MTERYDDYGSISVMVSGSRGWTDRESIKRVFEGHRFIGAFGIPVVPTLIHGGAAGADRLAASVAVELGWKVEAVLADWNAHGKRAGILRNLAMLDRLPDYVFIFWDGESRGTKHVIGEVERRGIRHQIERCDRDASK